MYWRLAAERLSRRLVYWRSWNDRLWHQGHLAARWCRQGVPIDSMVRHRSIPQPGKARAAASPRRPGQPTQQRRQRGGIAFFGPPRKSVAPRINSAASIRIYAPSDKSLTPSLELDYTLGARARAQASARWER